LSIENYNLAAPFWGTGGTQSIPFKDLGRGWNWLKALTGNTNPGAKRPLGWVSACAYSGAYSSGYGRFGCSGDGPAPELFDRQCAWGVTHFHPTGTGYLGFFYNYFLFTPWTDGANLGHISQLTDEIAHPGYYAAALPDYGATLELTATQCAALHRYRFLKPGAHLRIDTGNIGLRQSMGTRYQEKIEFQDIRKDAPDAWHGYIVARGTKIYFALRLKAQITSAALYNGVIELDFAGDAAEAVIGFSLKSQEQAQERADTAFQAGFDAVRCDAKDEWSEQLSRIRVDFPDAQWNSRFYSTLYHSLIKPGYYEDGFVDFQTMWDIYRTQLPLVLSLCPKVARKLLEFFMQTIEELGAFPVCFSMDSNHAVESNQACALAVYPLCDGFFRGILTQDDYPRVKAALNSEFNHARLEGKSPTHTLDLAGAFDAASNVALLFDDLTTGEPWHSKSHIWRSVYDSDTGYLVEKATYYEGTHRNYSFRIHFGMMERIKLAGGTKRFQEMLDDFFAVGYVPADNQDPRPIRPGYFEALNNETDMDTPYTYLWCGQRDRLAEISDTIRRHQFGDGEGGAPGNVDSGALSSWYVWSCLGLYPLTGTPYYLLGSPAVNSAEIDFAKGTLQIRVTRESPSSIYPAGYRFNGEAFQTPWMTVEEVERGGVLEFFLKDTPQGPSPIPDFMD